MALNAIRTCAMAGRRIMSTATFAKTYADSLNDLILSYRRENENGPFSMADIAIWAINNRRWSPQPRRLARELARHLAKAAKLQRHTDPQGRRKVRTYHAARLERAGRRGQMTFEVLWDHINTMSLAHARRSFDQRREQLSGGCRSLDTDIHSFNDNSPNAPEDGLQMSFEFTYEVESQHRKAVERLVSDEPPYTSVVVHKRPR